MLKFPSMDGDGILEIKQLNNGMISLYYKITKFALLQNKL